MSHKPTVRKKKSPEVIKTERTILNNMAQQLRAKFGQTYRDDVTGFIGTCTRISEDIGGERLVQLETMTGEGKILDPWFNENRLESAGSIAIKYEGTP